MFTKLKTWWAKYKQTLADRNRKLGFGWVMATYYLDGMDIEEIEAAALTPFRSDDNPDFDEGCRRALLLLRAKEAA